MKFSTKAEYGLRALVNLARHQGYYSLAQIAKEEKISLAYLERLFAKLKQAEIVLSQKGINGGYKLTRPLNQISVKDIFVALEGDISPYNCDCLSLQGICRTVKCSCQVKTVWQKLEKEITRTLESIKLSDLIK
jgi:Rrf2 family protein